MDGTVLMKLNAAKVRPREPLLLSAAVGLFAGVVAMIGTRDLALSLIVFGLGFVVCLVLFATFLLMIPNDDKPEERAEIFIPVLMRDQQGGAGTAAVQNTADGLAGAPSAGDPAAGATEAGHRADGTSAPNGDIVAGETPTA